MAIPKFKYSFSPFNLSEETPKQITRLQGMTKSFFAVATGAAWYASSADHALIVTVVAFMADTILGCIYVEKVEESAQ